MMMTDFEIGEMVATLHIVSSYVAHENYIDRDILLGMLGTDDATKPKEPEITAQEVKGDD